MQKKIALFVTSIHLLMVLMLFFSPVKKASQPKKHIAVRTLQPKPKTQASTSVAVRAPKKPAASAVASSPRPSQSGQQPKETVKKEPSQKPSKPPASKTTTAKPAGSSKPAPVKSKPIANQKKPAMVEKGKAKKNRRPPDPPAANVWKEIDEALAKIDDKVYSKPQSKLDVPQVKGSSSSKIPFPDFGEMEEEVGTHEEILISFLDSSLTLPEFGEVKIQLTVKKDGTVVRLVVLEAESQKNKAYLEKNLPLLKFPLILDKEKTFTLKFCNAIKT
jgi:hypothetical protein